MSGIEMDGLFVMETVRDLQYEFNRRQSVMMELDYKPGLKLPIYCWTIKEGDILRQRKEVKLSKLYRDAYLAWKGVYEDQEFQRFETAPVRAAYWSLWTDDIPGMNNGKTCIFRRYKPEKEICL